MDKQIPQWLAELDAEDLQFLKRFLLASGSLKALAAEYGISYPTIRARLDRLISKVEAAQDSSLTDPFQRRLQILVADGKIARDAAKELLEAYEHATQQE